MGLIDWLTSDWTTVAKREMFRCEDHSRTNSAGHVQKTCVLEHYVDARVEEHEETGERRIVLGPMKDSNVRHISCEEIPNVLSAEDGWGLSHTMYDVEYVKNEHDVETVVE